jgi:hypothetical protein
MWDSEWLRVQAVELLKLTRDVDPASPETESGGILINWYFILDFAGSCSDKLPKVLTNRYPLCFRTIQTLYRFQLLIAIVTFH